MGDIGGVRPDDQMVTPGPTGTEADRLLFEQNERLGRHWYTLGEHAWCLVGNGLSNQTFVRGPEGIIAIDTGESVEEMQAALAELRRVADEPIVAVLYTHFHYVNGTTAITDTEPVTTIHGHTRIARNLERAASEIAPAYGRGLVEQFGVTLPADGPDGLAGVGLGLAYRMPIHAPFTAGHVPVTNTFDEACTLRVAGLDVHVHPAPSDADDSVTFWFPGLGVAVHNIAWPALFNVFAIRGEEYRDPRGLLAGLDDLRALGAEHLIATHGPPMSGADSIAQRVTTYRDSIQFMWDQTARWANRGATGPELAHRIRLPDVYGDDWITQQHYGLVEHHVRQIRTGLFGFFDGDPANLLPLEPSDRADRYVAAMGGADAVRSRCHDALREPGDGLRWALELAAQLVARTDAAQTDRDLLGKALRVVARRTSSANVRNWCLTRARDLDGTSSLDRHRTHRLGRRQVESWTLGQAVSVLRVFVDPDRLDGVDVHVEIVAGNERCGLHFRNHIACPTDGAGGDVTMSAQRDVWNNVFTGVSTLNDAIEGGAMTVAGDANAALAAFAALDHPGFR